MKKVPPPLRARLVLLAAGVLCLAAGPSPAGEPATPGAAVSKIDPGVLARARTGPAEGILFLKEQADLGPAAALASKREKGEYVFRTLRSVAERTQAPLLKELEARGVEHRSLWVANMVWVRAGLDDLTRVAAREEVGWVHANPPVRFRAPSQEDGSLEMKAPSAVEWNVAQVGAPEAWAAGFTGEGSVVGGQDTGYQWDHPALKSQYRGWDGAAADHDYHWHDAVHSGGGVCGADAPSPCDDWGHGTHTMGTVLGDDGGANQTGVAPGARWIGCRNMDQGVGTPASYAECYQWFIAPTRIDGSDPDPSMAPDVVNNSWSCTVAEGCADPNILLAVATSVRAAGIALVNSAGNRGAACGTVNEPAGIYEASFSVGATDSVDAIASFSSRGPVTVDGSGRRKPDVAAPGVNVRSSVPGGGYGSMSGTSMASPHAAGLVALILSANARLAGQVEMLEHIMERSALPLTTSQGCGGDGPADVPNNVYGWGRIDAPAACQAAAGTGSLTVTLHPDGAAAAGARWRVDGGAWNESGQVVAGLAVSLHEVQFEAVAGWRAPPPQSVPTYASETAALDATYLPPAPVPFLLLLAP